jgi:hypothetical protein
MTDTETLIRIVKQDFASKLKDRSGYLAICALTKFPLEIGAIRADQPLPG